MSSSNKLTNVLYSLKLTKLDVVFDALYQECIECKKLSKVVKLELLNLSSAERMELMKTRRDGTPLFLAAKRGAVDIVEFLIMECKADPEILSAYEEPGDPIVHFVTPLWCAAKRGHLNVVKLLIRFGANVNTVSSTGSTPTLSACLMTHLDIVTYLVEHGADVNKANHDGGTCLMNSVKSLPLCRYLIRKGGAFVNAQDMKGRNALHYAIKELRLDTVKLLLDHGADPFAQNYLGDDALQITCLLGAQNIFDYLVSVINYPPERLANARELLGSTFLERHDDCPMAILNWRLAHFIRTCQPTAVLEKVPEIRRQAYGFVTEFRTSEELDDIALDIEQMRIQNLLISERVLGSSHKETLFRMMCQGAKYAEFMQYQKCLDIWKLCLEIRIDKLSILNCKTCMTAEAVVRLMLDLTHNEALVNNEDKAPKFCDILFVFELLVHNLKETRKWLTVRPVFKKQQQNFDRIFKVVSHLIYLLIVKSHTPDEKKMVTDSVTRLILSNIRSAGTNDSLLHLSLSRLNYIKNVIVTFPNFVVVKLLLECGVQVNAVNESKSTPLHIATTPYNFDNRIIKLLLDFGAHVDLPNKLKDRPADYIAINPSSGIPLFNYTTLKCLATTTVVKYRIPYKNQIPKTLERFVEHHTAV